MRECIEAAYVKIPRVDLVNIKAIMPGSVYTYFMMQPHPLLHIRLHFICIQNMNLCAENCSFIVIA